MEVICLEEAAFYALVREVHQRLKNENNIKEDKWISADEAMKKLRITSRTSLQTLRDEGKIEYSKLSKKHILYNNHSIDAYLEKNAKKTF